MILGTYEFPWNPDRWDPPELELAYANELTYESYAHYDWGFYIIGQEKLLEWNWMKLDQYNAFRVKFLAGAIIPWVPGNGYVYQVKILRCTGDYAEVIGVLQDGEPTKARRENVKMLLLITDYEAVS